MINKTETQTNTEQRRLLIKYANSNKIICLNCKKKINKGLMSWCSFKCEDEFKNKYNLKTQRQTINKVFEMVKEVLKE